MRALLYALTRQRFDAEDRRRAERICAETRIDWPLMAGTAAAEGVAPIVGVNLGACDPDITRVPPSVTMRFQQALFENAALKVSRRLEFAEQVADLDARGYDVLLLKSMALEAAGIYREPWVTAARDVDIAMRQRTPAPVAADDSHFRQTLNNFGVETEHPTGHHDLSLGGIIPLHVEEWWRSVRAVSLDGVPGPLFVLSPEDTLFVLCLNACRKGFLRLKVLFDIREAIVHHDDLDWSRFARRVARSSAGGVAYAALRAAATTVGLPDASLPRRLNLVSRARAATLDAVLTLARRAGRRERITTAALQHASLNPSQCWHNAKALFVPPPVSRSAAEMAASLLPGE
jgi:hypothetical protein